MDEDDAIYIDRASLRAIAKSLESQGATVLSLMHRIVIRGTPYYQIADPQTGVLVLELDAEGLSAEDAAAWVLAAVGGHCTICRAVLLEGEDDICSTCESTEIMGLLRLRTQLG